MTAQIIIPFRKGSKGLNDKALQTIGNETLVERTLRQVSKLGLPTFLYTDYAVSTLNMAGVVSWSGQNYVYIKRPEVSDDETTEACLYECLKEIPPSDVICFATVTTPFRKLEWMQECLRRMEVSWPTVDSSFVVEPTRKQAWKRLDSGWRRGTSGIYQSRQTQPPEAYIEHTGVFLVTKSSVIQEGRRIGDIVEPVVVSDPHVGVDIHTPEDLAYANWLLDEGFVKE